MQKVSTYPIPFSLFPQSLIIVIILISFPLFVINCGFDVEDSTSPSAPIWVQKSLPGDWPERGIDAHESGGIYLEWEPNSEGNIAAYLIFRAELFEKNDSLGEYELLANIETESITAYEYLDQSIQISIRYFYKLKAIDSSNNESDFSDSVTYMLFPSVLLNTMNPNNITTALNYDRTLSWSDYSHTYIELEDYCVTLLTQKGDFITRLIIQPSNYVGGREEWNIPSNIELESGVIYQWRIDLGANYSNGVELTGSESSWAKFLYISM